MNRFSFLVASIILSTSVMAQKVMTPELLWQVKKVSPVGITKDKKSLIYKVTSTDVKTQTDQTKTYVQSLAGGKASEIVDYKSLLVDKSLKLIKVEYFQKKQGVKFQNLIKVEIHGIRI